jgi:murein DD-endopeptidase MepM/ murein hydrolase activator NlpD
MGLQQSYKWLICWSCSFFAQVAFSAGDEQKEMVRWQGEFIQGGLIVGRLINPDVIGVESQGRTLQLTPEGEFVIGLGRDFKSEVEIALAMKDGSQYSFKKAVKKREYNIQYVEGVPARTVNPSEKHLKRIRSESAKVKSARKETGEYAHYQGPYTWPAKGYISGVYGSQRYYNGEPKRPHFGIDIANKTGTPVYAPVSGKVVLAEGDLFYSGGTLIVDHGHGVSSSFLHLSKLHVAVGDEIKQGQLIGEIGSSGRATGPHLDWRMNWFDQRVDPRLLMDTQSPPKK